MHGGGGTPMAGSLAQEPARGPWGHVHRLGQGFFEGFLVQCQCFCAVFMIFKEISLLQIPKLYLIMSWGGFMMLVSPTICSVGVEY